MDTRQQVKLAAEDLEIGESTYSACPECHQDGKFSVTRTDEGVLYHCFRASCGTSGFLGGVRKITTGKPAKDARKLRPYTKPLRPLAAYEWMRFLTINGLSRAEINKGRWKWAVEHNTYAMPVMNQHGWERGHLLRYYDGSEPKAVAYQHTAGPWQSWYFPEKENGRIVLVEDQVSALKLSRYVTSVAIMGTALSESGAMELANMKPKGVTIALDADASNSAYKLKRQYGLLFPQCDVVQLKKDVKDMSHKQIKELFSV